MCAVIIRNFYRILSVASAFLVLRLGNIYLFFKHIRHYYGCSTVQNLYQKPLFVLFGYSCIFRNIRILEIYALLYVIMCNLCMLEIYACQKCMNVRNLCMSGIHAELKYIHVRNI